MTGLQPESKSMHRRTFLKKAGKMCLSLLATGMIMGTYSSKFERFWYQIKEVRLKVKNLPHHFKDWKIVQFSDVHLGFHYGNKEFQKVVNRINSLNPDIIFFTGDLIHRGYKHPELAIPLLQELKAPRGGKWAIIGNHDYSSKDQVIQVFQRSNFKALDNTHDFIEFNQQRLYIAGVDDALYGNPNIGEAIDGLSGDDCVLLLAHEPDLADESSTYPIKAQFSGHSHGGQVRLPFYGPIFTPGYAHKYVDGYYQVGKKKMPLYVNRGIGTTQLAIRFFCRPEITIFHLS